jgi:hypothetical protein
VPQRRRESSVGALACPSPRKRRASLDTSKCRNSRGAALPCPVGQGSGLPLEFGPFTLCTSGTIRAGAAFRRLDRLLSGSRPAVYGRLARSPNPGEAASAAFGSHPLKLPSRGKARFKRAWAGLWPALVAETGHSAPAGNRPLGLAGGRKRLQTMPSNCLSANFQGS